MLSSFPEARVVDPADAHLLGSPIGDDGSISNTTDEKVHLLEIVGDRLQHLDAHDAILLLHHSFAIPKLLYTLRTSPCFLPPNLVSYDDRLRSIVSSITNIYFDLNDPVWTQASLPVSWAGHPECSSAGALCLPGFCCWLLRSCPSHPPFTSSEPSSPQRC